MSNLIFVQCYVDPYSRSSLEETRAAHLKFVASHLSKVVFGGLVDSGESEVEQICYFLSMRSVELAREFIVDDPYYPFYAKVDIHSFVQKIPVIADEIGT